MENSTQNKAGKFKDYHQTHDFFIEYDWNDRIWVCQIREKWGTVHGNTPEEAYKNALEYLELAKSANEALGLSDRS